MILTSRASITPETRASARSLQSCGRDRPRACFRMCQKKIKHQTKTPKKTPVRSNVPTGAGTRRGANSFNTPVLQGNSTKRKRERRKLSETLRGGKAQLRERRDRSVRSSMGGEEPENKKQRRRRDHRRAHRVMDLDEMTSGLQPSDRMPVAARPSMGKTSFVLNIALHVGTSTDMTVGLFSLEMSKEQLFMRMLTSEARIDAHRFRSGYPEREGLRPAVARARHAGRGARSSSTTPRRSACSRCAPRRGGCRPSTACTCSSSTTSS